MTTEAAARGPVTHALFRTAVAEPPTTATTPCDRSDQAMRSLCEPFAAATSDGRI